MYANTWEMTAEQKGWKVYKIAQNKEDAQYLQDQLRKLKIQCRRTRHVVKTIGCDCYFIWINCATLDKPFERPKRTVDKTNKRNIKCFNCKHWQGGGYQSLGKCVLTEEERWGYQMRMKCFEWKK